MKINEIMVIMAKISAERKGMASEGAESVAGEIMRRRNGNGSWRREMANLESGAAGAANGEKKLAASEKRQ